MIVDVYASAEADASHRNVNWTLEEDAILRRGREAGLTYEQISRRLPGRTARAVERRRMTLKLPARLAAAEWISGTAIMVNSLGLPPDTSPPRPDPMPFGWKNPDGCQWHLERLGVGRHRFCGEPCSRGHWCAEHRARVYE